MLGLLADTPLLTLVGAGGVGKTRMALEVADRLGAGFADGVCFVELAPVTDPALVVRTVASLLDVHEEATRPLLDTVLDVLRRRRMLLILDNCEHLVERCARVRRAGAAPQRRHPHAGHQPRGARRAPARWPGGCRRCAPRRPMRRLGRRLLAFPASRLFVERAQRRGAGFPPDGGQPGAAARVCHQLDGIPLALELAAARIGALTVEQLAERLDDRFRAADARPAHRAAAPPDAALADRLEPRPARPSRSACCCAGCRSSPAAGRWRRRGGVQRAADRCAHDVLDLLAQLVEKSLVVLDDAGRPSRATGCSRRCASTGSRSC